MGGVRSSLTTGPKFIFCHLCWRPLGPEIWLEYISAAIYYSVGRTVLGEEEKWMRSLCVFSRSSQVSCSNRGSWHIAQQTLWPMPYTPKQVRTTSNKTPPSTSGYITIITAVLNISFVPGNFPWIFQTEFTFFATDNHRWMFRDIK